MIKETKFVLLFLSAVILGLSGCGNDELNQGSSTNTPAQYSVTDTIEPIVSITPTPISTLTGTTIPTLTLGQAEQTFLELLANNGGCQLPCLWGIRPGETDQASFHIFADQFGDDREDEDRIVYVSRYNDVGGMSLISFKDSIRTTVDLSYFLKGDSIEYLALLLIQYSILGEGVETEYIELFGEESFNQMFSNYLLPQILNQYGAPSQVFISFVDESEWNKPFNWVPFNLVLFYPEKGVIVEYISPLQKEGGAYVGCPLEAHIEVLTWQPNPEIPLKEVVAHKVAFWGIHESNLSRYKPIEEVTDYSIDTFYEEFLNPENNLCIEISLSDWIGN